MMVLKGAVKFSQSLLAALVLTLCAFSGVSRAGDPPNAGPAQAVKPPGHPDDFAAVKARVVRFTLPNGLRVLFYPNKVAPVFTGDVWVKVGGVDERPGMTGIAHFLEHMAFKGTNTVGTHDYGREKVLLDELERLVIGAEDQRAALNSNESKEIYKQLEKLWVDNEFSRIYTRAGAEGLNAGTAKDYTSYTVSLPSVAFELWCWMESERLKHPVFRQFYKEREVVQEERRSSYEDNPSGRVYETLLQVSFLSHPNRLPVIGFQSDLKKLTRTEMERFYGTYYRPDNIVLSLAGDLDEGQLRSLIERYFAHLERPGIPLPQVVTVEEPQRGEREATVEYDAEPEFLLGYHKPVYPHPDDAKFALLHSVLGEGRSSILQKTFVLEKRLAASIYTTEAPGTRYPSLFVIGAVPKKGVSNENLRDAVQRLLEDFSKKGVSQDTLESAKRRVKVGLLKSIDSNGGLAGALGESELLWNDWQEFFKLYADVTNTTNEDLKRLVRDYLKAGNRTYVHLEKKKV